MSETGGVIAEPIRALAVPLATLNPDPANARKHGPKNLDAMKASLAKFGQRKPIVVQRDGMVVRAGNCVRWIWDRVHRWRADWAQGVWCRDRASLLRRDRRALGEAHRQEGGASEWVGRAAS